jgi:polyphosphate kinase
MTVPFLAALAMPLAATAHPHVFVEAQVTVIFSADGAVSVKLDWLYDDLFSLLVTSDLGIDMDGNLVLTAAEQALLDDQIVAWPPEYAGDLEVSQGDEILMLAEKQDHSMTYVDGLFHEAHVRPIAGLADPAVPLQIRVYDPSFYTA